MAEPGALTARIPQALAGQRLDQALAALFPDYSRSRLQQWIRDGQVRIGHAKPRPRDKVWGGELVELSPVVMANERWEAQDLPLNVVYEDEDLLVVDKPAGLVVHPAAGNPDRTLLNALLHYRPGLERLPRAGIVHRIDKDTSGLLVVAVSLRAHKALVEQLKSHAIVREYQAVVTGLMTAGGRLEARVGRHPTQRVRMAVVASGKPAVTHYRVLRRYRGHTHLQVRLETGRTHQVRVHMAHLGFPLVGDPVYGGRLRLPQGCTDALAQTLRGFRRQALHAARLQLHHPANGESLAWKSPLPQDMAGLLMALARDQAEVAPAPA